jgi:1,2-phenylacetyl-CoA epoxidase catalytic subunit
MHDPLIRCIESDIGQHSENLADALNRTHTRDGNIILQKLHAEGMLKKVQCEQIIMTPAPNIRIKLHELNKILDEMKQGEEATRKLAEMDKQLGMQDPAQVARMMRGTKDARVEPIAPVAASGSDALGDAQLANTFRAQAERMQREANGLMAEATRLLNEAASLTPAAPAAPQATKRPGRPKKSAVA